MERPQVAGGEGAAPYWTWPPRRLGRRGRETTYAPRRPSASSTPSNAVTTSGVELEPRSPSSLPPSTRPAGHPPRLRRRRASPRTGRDPQQRRASAHSAPSGPRGRSWRRPGRSSHQDPSDSRLDRADAAEGRREAQRPARVRARGREDHARRPLAPPSRRSSRRRRDRFGAGCPPGRPVPAPDPCSGVYQRYRPGAARRRQACSRAAPCSRRARDSTR